MKEWWEHENGTWCYGHKAEITMSDPLGMLDKPLAVVYKSNQHGLLFNWVLTIPSVEQTAYKTLKAAKLAAELIL